MSKMKKLTVNLIIIILMIISVQPVFAEDTEIEGLHENWSKLFMTNCFTEEEIAAMDEEYMTAWKEKLLNEIIPSRVALGRLETDTAETEYEYELEQAKLNYDNAVRVSLLLDYSYALEYANANVFSYLFSEYEYWSVPGIDYSDKRCLDTNGELIENIINKYGNMYRRFIVHIKEIEFLKNENNIKSLLNAKNETTVLDMKLFSIGSAHPMAFLYIKCQDNEYLLRLSENSHYKNLIQNTESEQLYNAKYIFSLIGDEEFVSAYVSSTKPTYQAEAEALQAEGLLYGNENGLDLLKPLSRIETAAMLLRALGESEDANISSAQVFTDVAPTHWGYGAAQNAYSLGLIYGVGDSLFAPDRKVTATEFSSMILRAMGENDFDWQSATDILIERGILTAEEAETMDLFTRGDMAKIIYEVRTRGLIG